MIGYTDISVRTDQWEKLRKLLEVEHEHGDGMNECDEPLIDVAIREIEKLRSAAPDSSVPTTAPAAATKISEAARKAAHLKFKEMFGRSAFIPKEDDWIEGYATAVIVLGSETPRPMEQQREEAGNLFRKKPVVIEAFQLTEKLAKRVWWEGESLPFPQLTLSGTRNPELRTISSFYISIRTREGTMRADPGDWVIKGVKGEFYPCKPDIFAATYEPVSSPATQSTDSGEKKPQYHLGHHELSDEPNHGL